MIKYYIPLILLNYLTYYFANHQNNYLKIILHLNQLDLKYNYNNLEKSLPEFTLYTSSHIL